MTGSLARVIASARVRLRPWQLDDVEAVMRYAPDPKWSEFLPVPHPYTRAHAEEFIAAQRLLDWDRGDCGWAITISDDGPEGGLNLRRETEHRAVLGYAVARRRWGQGYATETSRLVIDAAFNAWPLLQRIYAYADARNAASLRVMKKIGMCKEGTLRAHNNHRGVLIDTTYCGILRQDWEGTSGGAGLAP
jgi:RimJ/RimL family protein N-acetyltransferase